MLLTEGRLTWRCIFKKVSEYWTENEQVMEMRRLQIHRILVFVGRNACQVYFTLYTNNEKRVNSSFSLSLPFCKKSKKPL